MKKVRFTMFGKTKLVPHRTATNGTVDSIPKPVWHNTLWIERGEDWYALASYKRQTVLIVEREDWLKAKEV
jgi:hypothetical protein